MPTVLGQGSYGEVTVRDNKAVKKFSKLSHLIQEYMALKYLKECKYVVHEKGVDFENLELHMELYDGSLRKWLDEQRKTKEASDEDLLIILRDVLLGLIELHDRNLAHGDLKPGNILISNNPLKAVLGDCGFVSVTKYAKVDRTAATYREKDVTHEWTHDMYSFGICFLELMGRIKINRQTTYAEVKPIIRDKLKNNRYKKIVYNLLHEDKSRRPTARQVLTKLFDETPTKWKKPVLQIQSDSSSSSKSVSDDDRKFIRKIMKKSAHYFQIKRAQKGFDAIVTYMDINPIDENLYRLHTAVTLMILSSIFGESGFREKEVLKICNDKYTMNDIYKILEKLLSNEIFVKILLAP